MSVRWSPLKSPVRARAPAVLAQIGKSDTPELVTLHLPPPAANATGMVDQPEGPVSATSSRPSPLKSPLSRCAPALVAQAPKSPTYSLVTPHEPSSLEMATGMVFQPAPPNSAMSSPNELPSPYSLRSPA